MSPVTTLMAIAEPTQERLRELAIELNGLKNKGSTSRSEQEAHRKDLAMSRKMVGPVTVKGLDSSAHNLHAATYRHGEEDHRM